MKKALIVAAVAASFASAAQAQSSVTLYGLIDTGIAYQSNVNDKASWRMMSGGINESRFGLRGTEDLGHGLKGIFTLESGFALNNGALSSSQLFNRQAFVGLTSDYGAVTFGRQYDAIQDFISPFTAGGSWGGTFFTHYANLDNTGANGSVSANNTVKYRSHNYDGLEFGATYSFSNDPGFANNRAYSVGLAYQFEGLHVGAAYALLNNPEINSTGAFTGPWSVEPGQSSRARIYGAGASYAFGPAMVGIAWTQSQFDHFTDGTLSLKTSNYEVNGRYNLSSALALGAAYTYTSGRISGDKFHINQFGLQLDYSLSKRTDLYAEAIYQRSKGINASIYNGDPNALSSSGETQTAAMVGVRHRF